MALPSRLSKQNGLFWLGVLIALPGAILLAYTAVFVITSKTTTATVVDMRRSIETGGGRRGPRSRAYYPTVEFVDSSGDTHRIEFIIGSSFYNYRKGQTLDVRYRPGWPREVRIDSFSGVWGFSLMVFLFGAGVAGFATLIGYAFKLQEERRASRRASTKPPEDGHG